MEQILDFSKPLDVGVFEQTVAAMSSNNTHQVLAAQEVLSKFKSNPDSFFRCEAIVSKSTNPNARFIGLQILEEGISKRWNTFSAEQQQAVRNYLFGLIVQACSGGWAAMRSQRMVLTKMNAALVAIAKREWPHRWPTFIQDVCGSVASVDDPMVENNIRLLTLLGEDIFEFGDKGMTSRAVASKKAALKSDFGLVYQVVATVLTQSQDTTLINAALECFTRYAPWMPFENVFDPQFLEYLSFCVEKEVVRYEALRCLTEIAAAPISSGPAGDSQKQCMVKVFRAATQNIMNALPTGHSSLAGRMHKAAELDPDGASTVCQWLTTYLKTYLRYTLHDDVLVKASHELIVGLTHTESKEMFKACVEYWWWLGETMLRGFSSSRTVTDSSTSTVLATAQNANSSSTLDGSSVYSGIHANSRSPAGQLQSKLHSVLNDVRYALVKRMAKPEEVIIVEEEGEIRRENLRDVETLQLYHLMREALIFFTHLDPQNTYTTMTMLMARQLDRSEWSWGNCNTLCWAVGSISGSMSVEQEKDLFVAIMTDLLKLCKEMAGKENRAVIASNIMYVVGQYPRFLRAHKSFLRTVSRKLFEFMREMFPGIQDMAVDTFLKLAKLCPEVFLDAGTEPKPFVWTIVTDLWGNITELLQPAHIEAMYCAVGYMINTWSLQDEAQGIAQCDVSPAAQALLMRLLDPPTWDLQSAADLAAQNFEALTSNVDMLRRLLHILRIFSSVASSCGPIFIQQMQRILATLQMFYAAFSGHLSNLIATHGPGALSGQTNSRVMRLIKRECLKVIELFVQNTHQDAFVAKECMPQIFESVLSDYVKSHPLAREPGALALVTACVTRLKGLLLGDCAAILDHTFVPTVSLILENMADFPEHRVQLFRLLHALNEHCFEAFLAYTASHEDLVDSVLWAIKHTERNVMLTGLELLQSLLVKVVGSPMGENFYSAYMHKILTEVLVCALDTLHTSGFQLQCSVLQQLFQVSASVHREMPVVGRDAVLQFFQNSLREIPTLVPTQITTFVERCYELCDSSLSFRQHLADFLIDVQVWGAEQENALLKEESQREREACVPGIDRSDQAHTPSYDRFAQQTEEVA